MTSSDLNNLTEIDRNAVFEKFASIKRLHVEVSKKQTEDHQKRLQRLKEDESLYMSKMLGQQQQPTMYLQQDAPGRTQTSARRDLFFTSKNDNDRGEMTFSQQPYASFKPTNRTTSRHHDSSGADDHEWNIDDDFQPLNITDNEVLDERTSVRPPIDDDVEDSCLSAYHQMIQAHQQQQLLTTQQEQENMLSTILEASCEDATPMTSLVDVHQQRPPPAPIFEDDYAERSDKEEEEEEEQEDEDDADLTPAHQRPSVVSLDEMPVSTAFSKNENLKYTDFLLQKLQTEKDAAFANSNFNEDQTSRPSKEKRQFLRRRQGLAHYQAPPKRRQTCSKTTTENTKPEAVKRPTSASHTTNSTSRSSTVNNGTQRPRSRSSSASMTTGRQTPTSTVAGRSSVKTKPVTKVAPVTKTTLSSSKTSTIAPVSTQNNLLGQVDLDDEDELLAKKQPSKGKIPFEHDENENTPTNRAFASDLRTMIDTKWNAIKKPASFMPEDDEEPDEEEEDEDEQEQYSSIRQRTSSRSSGTQSKITINGPPPVKKKSDLDDFEQIEQYAEEHPSMISTASYVEQVVFQEHQRDYPHSQRHNNADVFVQRLTHYHDEQIHEENDIVEDLSSNTNRVRSRKIKPFKSKVDARIEQLTAKATILSDDDDDDDDDDEKHRWDDVSVAKVIPVMADEYNSDSGIGSLRSDLVRQQQYKKDSARSSNFDDENSWLERVTAPPTAHVHNQLMLKTFPGLRHTLPTPAPPPPPPPPPPSEPSQDLNRLIREKSLELEKQIETFQTENAKLQALCAERNVAIKKLKQDRDEFEKLKQTEMEQLTLIKEEEMKKLKKEKRLFEQHQQALREHPDKREREEIELLKKQVLTLQEDLKQRETRWSTTINRLKERIETLEYDNAELKQEKEIIERKRLDLMHQLQQQQQQQNVSKMPQDDVPSLATRKSLVELQQTKRAKSTVMTAAKTNGQPQQQQQSLPKTMVVRNTEPLAKPKVGPSGRRTPTAVVGVNGIKNNVETSRTLSMPATKKPPAMNEWTGTTTAVTKIDQPAIMTDRTDLINEDDRRLLFEINNERSSPSLAALVNSDYPIDDDESDPTATLDYTTLLTMATRASSSATTLLKQHQQMSLEPQPSAPKRPPLTITNNGSTTSNTMPSSSSSSSSSRVVVVPSTKTISFKENISTSSSNENQDGTIIEEIRHNDGRIERIRSDLSKQILFPNGSKQEISADGKQIRVHFYNGDYKEKLADGRCIYKYATTNTTETEFADGTRVYEFPNGQIEKHLPDGRQEHILPDRTKNIFLTDGTVISLKSNGEKYIQHVNQVKEVHTETFKRKMFPNGSVVTVYNTGEQEVRYANGKVKIKDAQGNTIVDKVTSK